MKNTLTKILAFMIAAIMLMGICSFAFAEADAINDVPYKTVELDESDPNYYKELRAAEIYNYKNIRSYPTLFEKNSWDEYQGAANLLDKTNPDEANEADLATVKDALKAREALIQVIPFDKEVYYIWGDYAPVTTEEHVWDESKWDNEDFRPFLIPYLVEDQSQAKGTLIIVSGGGYTTRSNAGEGYLVCPAFVERGYNCFLLQRRVDPYTREDTGVDLQRAIRWVRYHAEEFGLGGMDVIGAAGFSGGGGTIREQVSKFYGDITPDQFDSKYVPDAIDAVNGDLDVAMIIYSGGPIETENPNLPHFFIAIGEDDFMGTDGSIDMFNQMKAVRGNNPELHIYSQNGHGFGPGVEGTSSTLWIPSADLFMQKVMGKAETTPDGEIPEKYTKYQKVVYSGLPVGDVDAYVYMDAANTNIYITLVAFNDTQILEGMLQGDHIILTYDKFGYLGRNNDQNNIYALCDSNAWLPVER
ncbi:MAG: hypothetical protein IJ153_07785 [Clostridia bacterium]|nr:hypothetical protein [Clostridia bacterium]